MKTRKQKQAFTLIELIVVISILAILGTIAFISLQGFGSQSRDSARLSDVEKLKTALEVYGVETGAFPTPENGTTKYYDEDGNIASTGDQYGVWKEGKFDDKMYMQVGKLSKKPVDPLDKSTEYIYSKATNLNQYEILVKLEDSDSKLAFIEKASALADEYNSQRVDGTYNGYYVKAIGSTKVTLLATPSIITGDLEPADLNDNIVGESKTTSATGKEVDLRISGPNAPRAIKIQVVHESDSMPDTDEEIKDFTKELKKSLLDPDEGNGNILKDEPNYDSLEAIADTDANNKMVGDAILGNSSSGGSSVASLPQNSCTYGYGTIGHGGNGTFYTSNSNDDCSSISKSFTCDNGTWKDGENVKSTHNYAYCTAAAKCFGHNYEDKAASPSWLAQIPIPETTKPTVATNYSKNYTSTGLKANFTYSVDAECKNIADNPWAYTNKSVTVTGCLDNDNQHLINADTPTLGCMDNTDTCDIDGTTGTKTWTGLWNEKNKWGACQKPAGAVPIVTKTNIPYTAGYVDAEDPLNGGADRSLTNLQSLSTGERTWVVDTWKYSATSCASGYYVFDSDGDGYNECTNYCKVADDAPIGLGKCTIK
ncbi:MAG: type II secretion system GspH family protein [Candidatus Gracilibacteria bacterium]|nr:type II secretion system GspH family protein [Candidatus Gracilibacteria bacterium]